VPDLTLPAFHITKLTRITVEADYPLTQDLEQYRAFYRQAHHAAVTDADLLREMARQFMAADRAFQQFKQPSSRTRCRPSRAKPKPAPEAQPGSAESSKAAAASAES
jgi:hypothetical protein